MLVAMLGGVSTQNSRSGLAACLKACETTFHLCLRIAVHIYEISYCFNDRHRCRATCVKEHGGSSELNQRHKSCPRPVVR